MLGALLDAGFRVGARATFRWDAFLLSTCASTLLTYLMFHKWYLSTISETHCNSRYVKSGSLQPGILQIKLDENTFFIGAFTVQGGSA